MSRCDINIDMDECAFSIPKEIFFARGPPSLGGWPTGATSTGSTADTSSDDGSNQESHTPPMSFMGSAPKVAQSDSRGGRAQQPLPPGRLAADVARMPSGNSAFSGDSRARLDSAESAAGKPVNRGRFQAQFHKTQMCRYLRLGCVKGDQCLYAHHESELSSAPDLTKTSLCKLWQEKRCLKDSADCAFAHGIQELRSTSGFPRRPGPLQQPPPPRQQQAPPSPPSQPQPQPFQEPPPTFTNVVHAGTHGAGAADGGRCPVAPGAVPPAALAQSRERFQAQFWKTQLCRYVKVGCAWAETCPYAHSLEELRPAPDLVKTSLCKQWERGMCPLDASECQFAHGHQDLRSTDGYPKTTTNAKPATRGKGRTGGAGSDPRFAHCAAEPQAVSVQEQYVARLQEPEKIVPVVLQEPLKVNLSSAFFGGEWMDASSAPRADRADNQAPPKYYMQSGWLSDLLESHLPAVALSAAAAGRKDLAPPGLAPPPFFR